MLARLPYCISIPKPLLGSILLQTAKNLALIQAQVTRHGSDDTIGLDDLFTRQDALASILGVQHVRCSVNGLQAEVFTLFGCISELQFPLLGATVMWEGQYGFILLHLQAESEH